MCSAASSCRAALSIMQQQLAAQLAALAAALPSDASQAQRRALVRAAIIHAPGSHEELPAAQSRRCQALVLATILANDDTAAVEVIGFSCSYA